jgi:hypothetical protein
MKILDRERKRVRMSELEFGDRFIVYESESKARVFGGANNWGFFRFVVGRVEYLEYEDIEVFKLLKS